MDSISLPDILAVIGAAYTLARCIVALTPTPRDDAALGTVATWLRLLAKALGLDLKQGRTKGDPPPPWLPLLACLILPALLLTGTSCQSLRHATAHERSAAAYTAASHSYAIALQGLTAAYQAGQIPAAQVPAIDAYRHTAAQLLDEWQIALANGRAAPDIERSAVAVIAMLRRFIPAEDGEPH